MLLEPLGVAHNGVETIQVMGAVQEAGADRDPACVVQVAGHDVLVLGAGPIGLLAAQCAAAEGATRVILADINPYRLELAAGMEVISCPLVTLDISSCDLATEVKRLTGGAGVARLVEATGAPPIVNSCFRWHHQQTVLGPI